ncbi:class E vacuolar protein-sorting machinery protein HSE1-like [Coregonus clupeaformis]|uniref:class E vacuolar protein-sorting machinery protein HSE1-like n=1 Tax=Coregonus clupeaformis TaxID=59861 RepID=UPI001BE061A1|nr:class E vacuolar protein-sorting machinery protein HSE1-like [Coregonus clupeaformis]XP_041744788.1 class E vacuolar protein-sorting machinery protein HSE1-like [Coregonus clupeaformis]
MDSSVLVAGWPWSAITSGRLWGTIKFKSLWWSRVIFQKCVSGSPKYSVTALNSLSELPERGFRADGASNSSHFVYQMHQPSSRHPPLNFPTSPHTFILESNRASSHYGNPPHPLPRRALPKPKVRRVQAIYDCVADHHDELTFNEGEIMVVLEEDDADWWEAWIR